MSQLTTTEEQKKEVFRRLIEGEDAGEDPKLLRKKLIEEFQIDTATMRSIEETGIEEDWPPLEPCDDEESDDEGEVAAA